MLELFNVNVRDIELEFDLLCKSNVVIDRIEIESNHPMTIGWCEIRVVDHTLYRGPARWFSEGGLNLSLSVYENIRVIVKSFDSVDRWFHGSKVRIKLYDVDKEIKVIASGKYSYVD